MLTDCFGGRSAARGYTPGNISGVNRMNDRIIAPRPSHRRAWTAEEDRILTEMIGKGELIGALANALGRTREAVRNRANLLGLPVRSSEGSGRRRLSP